MTRRYLYDVSISTEADVAACRKHSTLSVFPATERAVYRIELAYPIYCATAENTEVLYRLALWCAFADGIENAVATGFRAVFLEGMS